MSPREQLLQEFFPTVRSMVNRTPGFEGSPDVAEQECRKALFTAFQKWDGDQSQIKSWVFTSVRGKMQDLKKISARENARRPLLYMDQINPADEDAPAPPLA